MYNLKSMFSYLLIFLLMSMNLMFIYLLIFVNNKSGYFFVWELVGLMNFSLDFSILLDQYSLLFGFTITAISSSVMLFSSEYMKSEKFYLRFHSILLLFIISMFFLIMTPNIFGMFLGWDGLGVTSYFLVIYFQKDKSLMAGMLTLMSNRVGDVFLMLVLGQMLVDMSYMSFINKSSIFILEDSSLLFFLIMAALTKSAQIPYSAWLPAAMAAPTPVSALVHSSTLVTAGVYLVFRCSMLHDLSFNFYSEVLMFAGGFTMLMAGFSAMGEMDAKKVVALSTLSQLGFMMLTLSMKNYDVAFIHLNGHAFFKALLFISVGSLISSGGGYQDLRMFGVLLSSSPFIKMVVNISSLSLCGFFFLSGFYTKDLCLEALFFADLSSNLHSYVVFFLVFWLSIFCLDYTSLSSNFYREEQFFSLDSFSLLFFILMFYLGVALTVSYTARFFYYTNMLAVSKFSLKNKYLSNKLMISTIYLLFLSVVGGSMMFWFFLYASKLIYILSVNVKVLPVYIFFFCFLSVWLSMKNKKSYFYSLKLQKMLNMWSLPLTSMMLFQSLGNKVTDFFYLWVDKGYLEKVFFCWSEISYSSWGSFLELPKYKWVYSIMSILMMSFVIFFF